jgi:hypothetical protein
VLSHHLLAMWRGRKEGGDGYQPALPSHTEREPGHGQEFDWHFQWTTSLLAGRFAPVVSKSTRKARFFDHELETISYQTEKTNQKHSMSAQTTQKE